MYRENNSGQRKVPCGILDKSRAHSEVAPLTTLLCFLQQTKESIHLSVFSPMPKPNTLLLYSSWGCVSKKVREKSRECHNHKPQPFPDPKRKRKPIKLNKHKSNKHTKSTKISSLFPKRGNRNTKRTEKHKNKMTHGKTYNKSPRRINHKKQRRVRLTPGPPP